jgi:hypothetical protein
MLGKDYSPGPATLVIEVEGDRFQAVSSELVDSLVKWYAHPLKLLEAVDQYVRFMWTEFFFKHPPGDRQVIPFPTWYILSFNTIIDQHFGEFTTSGDDRTRRIRSATAGQELQVGMVYNDDQTEGLYENERHVYIQKCFGSQGNLDPSSIESAKDILVQMWTNLQPLVGKQMFGKCNSLIQSLVDGIRC